MAVLYAGSIVCWAAAARYFGALGCASPSPRLCSLYQGYALMFHELSSEPVFAAAFAALGAARRRGRRSRRRSAGSRSSASASRCSRSSGRETRSCSRSSSFPLVARRGMARRACAGPARVALAAVLPARRVVGPQRRPLRHWALARGGNAIVPFYRAFITDHIVSPENGESSRRLAAAMQRAPADARAVPLVRRHARPALRERELPRPRGPLPAVRRGLRMGLRLRDPPRGRRRGRARPPGRVRTRRRADGLGRALEGAVPGRVGARANRRRRRARRPSSSTDKRLPAPTEGRADPVGPGRLDLAARQQHSTGLDVADRMALRVRAPVGAPALRARSEREADELFDALPDRAGQRAARTPPQPAVALVPASVDVDPRSG